MVEVHSMWRTELWHPLIVHLPITALLLAAIAGLLQFILSKANAKIALQMCMILLVIGVAGGWAAIYTGLLAYNIEVRKICDPKVLQEHELWAYVAIIIFSVALAIHILKKWLGKKFVIPLNIICGALYILGAASLLYSGHLGATVVYQQGAGVHKPKPDCSDYIID
ncbi:DUF2231 domain-containing protein [Flavobacterium rhizosphaerae]|uniref:DUF2231 domain-containing protein n=1 Tax=Flavobacterium rhizosphaerae TaxID=3163298 RepID=A0ABW8YTG2_9FLAO